MVTICPSCSNSINEGEIFCPSCGAKIESTQAPSQPHYTQPIGYNVGDAPKKSNKKLIGIIVIIIAIVAIIAFVYFFLMSSGDPSDFIGSWDVQMEGMTTQVWTFQEGGTLKMSSSSNGYDFEPSISFAKDISEQTLTVAYVGNPVYEQPYASYGSWKLDGDKICITASGMTLCFDYQFSDNGNRLTLTGTYQFTLVKRDNEPEFNETEYPDEDLKWSDLEIRGTCDTSGLGEYGNRRCDNKLFWIDYNCIYTIVYSDL